MADSVPAAYLSKLRDNHPHMVRHFMSIYQPTLVYTGTVAGGPARGARAITVSNVSGTISNVRAEDTVVVKTSAGVAKSTRRFKSRVGQVLTLDENSVSWTNGDILYVYHDIRVWGVWPREPNVAAVGAPAMYVWYKDYDVAYTDQNLKPPPVAIMGWHRAKIMHGSSVVFNLHSGDSYAVAFGATISSRLWACSTGTISNTGATNPTITFTAVGQHEISLTVTDSKGKSQTTRRIYFVHDSPGPGAVYPPFIDFDFDTINLDWSNGGADTSITFRGDTVKDISSNTLVIIWAENYFQGALNTTSMWAGSSCKASILNDGGSWTKFVGYLADQSLPATDDAGSVTIRAYTIDTILKKISMASVGLNNVASPLKWYEIYKLTVTRAIHHYLRWHSNVFTVADVILPQDDTLELFASDDLTEGKLYDSADTFSYQHGIFAHICCDKYGRMHMQRDISMQDPADRAALGTYFTLMRQDVKMMSEAPGGAQFSIVRDTGNRIALAIIRGASYVAGVNTPLISQAPGEIPEDGDQIPVFERIALEDQAHTNRLSGRVYAIGNREFVELRCELAGNYYDIFDVAEQLFVVIDYTAGGNYTFDNIVDRDISGSYTIKNISYVDNKSGVTTTTLVLEPDVDSYDGVTILWPDDPETIVPPRPRPPPPVVPPPLPPPLPPPPVTGLGALVSCENAIRATTNISVVTPTWTDKT